MIIAQPFSVDWGTSGAALGYTLYNATNGVLIARTTAGITESPIGSGLYNAVVPSFDTTWSCRIVWDDGTSNTAEESFDPLYTPTPTAPNVGPVFEYIPTFSGTGNSLLRIASISGLSTQHGCAKSDRGRIYGSLTYSAGTYFLTLFWDRSLSSPTAIATGQTGATLQYLDIAAVNNSGVSGRAWIDSYTADDSSIVALPTFAVDEDIAIRPIVSKYPCYDAKYGLGYIHAMAMRQIMASDLPAALPDLYISKVGLGTLVPNLTGPAMPDLRNMANADQLRIAQSSLVKYLVGLQSEHIEQYALMAENEEKRYADAMKLIRESNVKQREAEDDEDSEESVTWGSFCRG